MAKKTRGMEVTHCKDLSPQRSRCPVYGDSMWSDYTKRRSVVTLDGVTLLNLAIRRFTMPPAPLICVRIVRRPRDVSPCPITNSAWM
jgi:hypothetical protein